MLDVRITRLLFVLAPLMPGLGQKLSLAMFLSEDRNRTRNKFEMRESIAHVDAEDYDE